ncbi:DUF1367 family protein [Variovorax sp. PMC12]|uniref:DUF1367 family protein n=1 Tax=Variovorax sp. PMC12 TaxID=2126319 RepID=UPI000D11EBED|nr:DUF1367 family protein [Variovorax sp. PMC12]AVQ84275.1 hypothetical protein C4F17_26840 [Variovorax sp. PMC12]
MADIVLVRQQPVELPEEKRAIAREVFTGHVDGLGQQNQNRWRRFLSGLMRLEPGEMMEVKTHQQRLGWYHRKHMALEQAVFQAQERFEAFEPFRDWLKVGAGHVEWYPGPKGGVFPVPKSISYSKMEQGEMEVFHANAVAFLRTEHAGKTLWRHLSTPMRIQMIETVLGEFRE